MGTGRAVWVSLLALVAILLCRSAWSQENEGGAGQQRPFRPGAEGRPGIQQGPGVAAREMMVGMDIPAVREEMARHMQEMRTLMMGQRDLAQQVAAEAGALREKKTPQADIDKALAEKFGTQAQEVATKVADELAKHYENLTKVYKDNRDETVKALAQSILRRMANREPGGRLGGPGFEKGARPFPKAKEGQPKGKDNLPENF